ncbi:hypothetical protein E2C01_008980 [Portunus trituberculatus]|uniref:Uncharacterized protein n=1 Tax=Portunus trituberculatus TaxID=210409 RepID=A0A5B7D3G2_PORTR|nr:hypothetical protein [Portunus trituberculatus]
MFRYVTQLGTAISIHPAPQSGVVLHAQPQHAEGGVHGGTPLKVSLLQYREAPLRGLEGLRHREGHAQLAAEVPGVIVEHRHRHHQGRRCVPLQAGVRLSRGDLPADQPGQAGVNDGAVMGRAALQQSGQVLRSKGVVPQPYKRQLANKGFGDGVAPVVLVLVVADHKSAVK